ncbi:MAG: hypothetical protein ACTHVM_07160, partial [Alkalibacterium gilvum]
MEKVEKIHFTLISIYSEILIVLMHLFGNSFSNIGFFTTVGYQYIQSVQDTTTKEKIKSVLREEGIPMT